MRSYLVKKENGRETIRSARHIKFAAIREDAKVMFEDNLVNEAMSDDDADSDNAAARVDTAMNGMNDAAWSESMDTESCPAHRTRA